MFPLIVNYSASCLLYSSVCFERSHSTTAVRSGQLTVFKLARFSWDWLRGLIGIAAAGPTRERAGWTGDGGLTREVTSYNFEMGPFYRKWLNDIGDAQATFRNQCMTQLFPRRPTHVDCDCAFRNCTGEVPPAAPWYQHGYHGGNDPADQLNLPGTGAHSPSARSEN